MARIYRGTDLRLDRPVAIKVMRLAAAAHAARFEREAKAAAQLSHPAVVAVHDHGVLEDGRHYLVLEFVAGRNLAQVGQVDPATAVAWLRPVVGALVEAHAAGIIHRDIKPENLILAEAPGVPPTPRLLDFGIAAVDPLSTDERLTATGAVFGTPAFMSPEQALGKPVTPAADLWAIGATLYALIAGRAPFKGETAPETLVAVIKERPPPLPEAVPQWIRELVKACLEKDPNSRPADARALLARMTTSHSSQSDTVFEPSPPAPVQPRPGIPTVALVAIGVLVGVVLTLTFGGQESEESKTFLSVVEVEPDAAPDAPDPLDSARKLVAAEEHAAALAWLETHPQAGDPNARLFLRGHARLAEKQVEDGLADLTAALTSDPSLAAADLVPTLVDVLQRRDAEGAVGLLAGPLAQYAAEPLAELPSTARHRTRWRAVEILERIDPDNRVPRFQALLRDLAVGECELRKKAANALGELGNPEAIGPLRRARGRGWLDNMCMDGALDRAIHKLNKQEKP